MRFMSTIQVLAKEDMLDQQVAYFFTMNPQVKQRHSFNRRPTGAYELNGREIVLEWQPPKDASSGGHLAVIVDGSTRQPLIDYISNMEASDWMSLDEATASFTGGSCQIPTAGLTAGMPPKGGLPPKDRVMTFNDLGEGYSRLDAMKVAKEQALVREKAAGYIQAGKALPEDIMENYRRSLQKKLAPVSISKLRARGAIHGLGDRTWV